MNGQGFSADKIALLVSNSRDDEESSSDEEAIGDFTSDSHTYVLSSESLAHGSRAILSLPSPAERDSLLLCEASDSEDTASAKNDEDIVGDSGTINNSDNEAEDEAEDNDSEVDNNDANDSAGDSSDSEFEFTWCDIKPNFVEPDLPDFMNLLASAVKLVLQNPQ